MKNTILKHWTGIVDHMHDDDEYPAVELDTGYFGIRCRIEPDGLIKVSTRSGGGHGEGTHDDSGRSIKDWMNMLNEAEMVREHYWGKK